MFRRVLFVAAVVLPATVPRAGGLAATWYASDPAKRSGLPAIIALDASGSASFGRLDCRWKAAPLSLGDQKYCADACTDRNVRKAVIQCGADTIRLYCLDDCDMAMVSVGNEYGSGQLYFTRERLRSDHRAPPGTATAR
jgi:hypothetical protein